MMQFEDYVNKAAIASAIIAVITVILYKLHKKDREKIDFLKTCNLSALSLEELQKWQIWLYYHRKSSAQVLYEFCVGFTSDAINSEILEIETKIEEELGRRLTSDCEKKGANQ
ncbi:MAG: hypothetical protein IJR39_12255 [Treponema sp.]|nr:hypothetical protein [Treponema sp.]